MTAQPQWSAVDDDTADLLTLVADGPAEVDTDVEWDCYVASLEMARRIGGGLIYPNDLRDLVRGKIAPRRISAFSNRARARGLVEYTGEYEVSDDREGRNGGKPCRVMRWIGGPL